MVIIKYRPYELKPSGAAVISIVINALTFHQRRMSSINLDIYVNIYICKNLVHTHDQSNMFVWAVLGEKLDLMYYSTLSFYSD